MIISTTSFHKQVCGKEVYFAGVCKECIYATSVATPIVNLPQKLMERKRSARKRHKRVHGIVVIRK